MWDYTNRERLEIMLLRQLNANIMQTNSTGNLNLRLQSKTAVLNILLVFVTVCMNYGAKKQTGLYGFLCTRLRAMRKSSRQLRAPGLIT